MMRDRAEWARADFTAFGPTMSDEFDSSRVQKESALKRLDSAEFQKCIPRPKKNKPVVGWLILACLVAVPVYLFVKSVSVDSGGSTVEIIVLSTTVNGQVYEKEARPGDLDTDFVNFADGVRVP